MSKNIESQETIDSKQWFICKRETGICEIISSTNQETLSNSLEIWGAFDSQGEAIAKRVGLIRAGKCQPQ